MPSDPKHDAVALELPACFGPYLRYGISVGFKNFESFDNEKFQLFLLVKFKNVKASGTFEIKMRDPKNDSKPVVEFGPTDPNSRFATVRCPVAAIAPATYKHWIKYVSRVELSLPVAPNVAASIKRVALRNRKGSIDTPTDLLIGVIDDGCPFAAARMLKVISSSGDRTRVRGIWDQDQDPSRHVITVDANTEFGERLSDFKYGLEFLRDTYSPTSSLRKMGLNDWIKLHSASNVVDEDGCYADAELQSLKYRASHGAHVADLAAGRIPLSARIGDRDPPTWLPGIDPASSADIVYVQFSKACLRDATGVWLKSYVVDAVYYIMSFVDPTKTTKVVINLSYGPTTGPHDGTHELEQALQDLVAQYDGTGGTAKLDIVVSAGNAYLSEGHVKVIRRRGQPNHVKWTWRLPPDNSTLCFAEIWIKKAYGAGVVVTLTSPSGHQYTETVPVTPPPNPRPPAGVDVPIFWGGNNKMWRLHVEPTLITSDVVAEHGDYTVEITNIPVNAKIHAYVARTDPNMNIRSGAKRSYFIDPKWQQTRSAAANCKYVNGQFDRTGSIVRRDGTLNGIATTTPLNTSVHVAGGYVLTDQRKSWYSSAGRARGGPRKGPDFALPCDQSRALQGIRAGANRSGGLFRLVGTSAAAPQLARYIGNRAAKIPINTSGTPEDVGAGDLKAP